jgi:nuclear mRNA export protein SAC3
LQSLKEFYEDQRGRYESPDELEMGVYHRLIHIRDQMERHEEIPTAITNHAVFKLTMQFRLHVQAKSAPITKKSPLVADDAMHIFGELARVLSEMGNCVMRYLIACILERLFGPEPVEDIESLRGDLSLQDILDGISREEPFSFKQVILLPLLSPSNPAQRNG